MKKLTSIQRLLLILFGASLFFVSSCKKHSDDPVPIVLLPKLDGFYIYGTNTVASEPTDPTAKMNLAVLDSFKTAHIKNAPGYYGKFLYIGANSTISFAKVDGETGTIFGAANGGSTDSTTVVGNMDAKDMTIHGTLVKDEAAINVTEEGLYYAFVIATTDVPTFTLTRVKTNVIGDATENGWGTQTDLTQVFSSKDSTAWQITNLNLQATYGYKYRLPKGGWQFYATPDIITVSSLAVKNYGASWEAGHNDIGLYNENIPTQVTGKYTLRVTYFAATDTWKESKVKTGDWVPNINYTDYHMGLWGDAMILPNTDPADTTGWDIAYENKLPNVAGGVYTWTWTNVHLIEGREFIFIKDSAWDGGLILDATGIATIQGTATTDNVHKVDGGPNFHVYNTGQYDLTLVFDNSGTPTKRVTINNH